MGEVSRMKATAPSLKRDLAAVEAQLIDLSDDSILDETLQAIEKLPFVIGLRPDSHGRLVVFCRLFTTDHDAEGAITGDRHIGDFELTLKVAESDCSYLGVCLNLPARVREVISSTKGLYCHRE